MKFSSDVAGSITGIRFYKGAGNGGTHVAHLWSSTGNRLASATFTSETASGWQQVNFATPVAIAANTTYVASYFAPAGHYAGDNGYFSSGYSSGPLDVPANGGVYVYGSQGGFPSQTWKASNYWVDVAFSTTTPPTATPRRHADDHADDDHGRDADAERHRRGHHRPPHGHLQHIGPGLVDQIHPHGPLRRHRAGDGELR